MTKSIAIKQLPKGRPVNIGLSTDENLEEFYIPHRHEYYEVIWTLEGSGSHCIDFVEYPLTPGSVYLLVPGQVHETVQFPKKICFITFSSGFLDGNYRDQLLTDQLFYQFNGQPPCLHIDPEAEKDLYPLVTLLQKELNRTSTDWPLVSPLLNTVLHMMARFRPIPLTNDSLINERVIQLFQLIEAHFRQEKKTDFYAGRLSLSNKRVNELMREHSGKTVSRIIHDRIILEAHRELSFTTKTVTQIAYDLHYDDVSYFCRFFRKMTGETPKAFRDRTFK